MKKIISVFLTLMMLSSMLATFSVTNSAETVQYLESLQIGVADNNQDAKDCATKDGYKLVGDIEIGRFSVHEENQTSLKNFLPESFDHIYLSYKTTSNPENAICDIIGTTDSKYKGKYEFYNEENGCTYYSIGGYYLDSDNNVKYSEQLNGYYGAGVLSDKTSNIICYLYATKDERAGNPIQNPTIVLEDAKDTINNPILLNNYVFGSYAYFCYEQYKPNYISALQLGVDFYTSVAKDHAQFNFDKCSLIDVNLNSECGTFYDGIYLAYQRSNLKYQAIRNIICLSGEEYSNCTSWINEADGCTYYPVGGYDGDLEKQNILNVNDDGDGAYLYLFYTCDSRAGDPITSLSAIAQATPYDGTDAVKFTDGSNADLNKDAGGDYVYLIYKSYQLPSYGSLFSDSTSWWYVAIGGIVIIGIMAGIILIKKKKSAIAA